MDKNKLVLPVSILLASMLLSACAYVLYAPNQRYDLARIKIEIKYKKENINEKSVIGGSSE